MQEGERILYFASPHSAFKYLHFAIVIGIGLFLLLAFQTIFFVIFPQPLLQILFLILPIIILGAILWWIQKTFGETELFVTDRRVVKFSPTSPSHKTVRSLFWDQTVKVKTYHQNPIIDKVLGTGSITINAKSESDDVDIDHIIYHHDLGNYIDKILFTFHNNSSEVVNIREFVPKPRGQRY